MCIVGADTVAVAGNEGAGAVLGLAFARDRAILGQRLRATVLSFACSTEKGCLNRYTWKIYASTFDVERLIGLSISMQAIECNWRSAMV